MSLLRRVLRQKHSGDRHNAKKAKDLFELSEDLDIVIMFLKLNLLYLVLQQNYCIPIDFKTVKACQPLVLIF